MESNRGNVKTHPWVREKNRRVLFASRGGKQDLGSGGKKLSRQEGGRG